MRSNRYSEKQLNNLYDLLNTNGIYRSMGYNTVFRTLFYANLSVDALLLYIYLSTRKEKELETLTITQITLDLCISRTSYYMARAELEAEQLIEVDRSYFEIGGNNKHLAYRNTYKYFCDTSIPVLKEALDKNYKVKNLYESGTALNKIQYGLLPRSIMVNKNISKLAKVIYAYFTTFADSISTAPETIEKDALLPVITQPSLTKNVLGISTARYTRAVNELIACNFLERTKRSGSKVTYSLVLRPTLEKVRQVHEEKQTKKTNLRMLKDSFNERFEKMKATILEMKSAWPNERKNFFYATPTFNQTINDSFDNKETFESVVAMTSRTFTIPELEQQPYVSANLNSPEEIELFLSQQFNNWIVLNNQTLDWFNTDIKQTGREITMRLTRNSASILTKAGILKQLDHMYQKTDVIHEPITYFINGVSKLSIKDYQHKLDRKQQNKQAEPLPIVSLFNWLEEE
ncbi:hypothetical protein IGI37_003728 [Enterococcus sp. AZ194]|uniref:hypothetical protein n=1 Tax=Enterococcus sp. AZ194 TaxID=2774629 RepID=UPI003F249BD1